MLQKPSFFRAKVWHSDQASEDYLSVNFGAKPFYYQIPPGYTTLDQDPIKCLTFNHPSIYFGGTKVVEQNTQFSLTAKGPFYSSNVNRTTPGRWYYEFTHFSGPNLHLAGFEFDTSNVFVFAIYPKKLLPDSTAFYLDCQAEVQPYQALGFKSLKSDSTIGISFDSYINRIDFRTETETKGYFITLNKNPKFYRAVIWHADTGDPDTVSVNFGAKPFRYPIPTGYTTLDKDPPVCKSIILHNVYYHYFISMISIVKLS